MSRPNRVVLERVDVARDQIDFVRNRVRPLVVQQPDRALVDLLANAYCQGLTDAANVQDENWIRGRDEGEAEVNPKNAPAEGTGKPDAWRYRYPNDPTWQLTLDRKQAHDKTGEVQALALIATHPVQGGEGRGERKGEP